MTFTRYAIYYTPEPGALAEFGATWLGWDAATGKTCAHPEIAGLPAPISEITATPRKYGFHGTIKPPMVLADGTTFDGLAEAFKDFCATRAPVVLDGLALTRLGSFLAMTPVGDSGKLADLAGSTVAALDTFRAPQSEAQLARRRAAGLSPRQEANLVKWGYPYVFEEFRFHLTLTGKLERDQLEATRAAIAPLVDAAAPGPGTIRDLTLLGEAEDGRFHQITRCALTG
jgi:putative phosphonate metabolism protein